MFEVTLIKVLNPKDDGVQELLDKNCTYIRRNYWFYEGDIDYLEDKGVRFIPVKEGAVDSLGGLSEQELVEICKNNFNYHDV